MTNILEPNNIFFSLCKERCSCSFLFFSFSEGPHLARIKSVKRPGTRKITGLQVSALSFATHAAHDFKARARVCVYSRFETKASNVTARTHPCVHAAEQVSRTRRASDSMHYCVCVALKKSRTYRRR